MQIGINIAVKGARTSGPSSAPVNTVAPVISGNTTIGSTLTLTNVGSYTGTAPITYTYQWYRGATVIIGQTSTTYITQSADEGLQVTCQVQASNAYGSTFVPSNYIIPVALFTTTWTTTAPNQTITLPYVPTGIYSGTIDWGDGNTSVNNGTVTTHTYATAGTYTVIITGDCIGWNVNLLGGSTYWTSVVNWGQLQLDNLNSGYNFAFCPNLDLSSVQGTLNLTGVTNLDGLFYECTSITTINNINSWDTSAITTMAEMFYNCSVFNQPLSFNTSAVTNMGSMFIGCLVFNQPLSFNTAAVTYMGGMFSNCTSFNQALTFNTSAVTSMDYMFSDCTVFNQPLTFNTAAVTNMNAMFSGCTSFNQSLSFDTSSVTSMIGMFQACPAFNSTLTFSSTAAVTTMADMFNGCTNFNQPLTFNTSAVIDMISMFYGATSFNQPLSFNTAAVTDMEAMFYGATAFNQNIGGWNVSSLASAADFMATKTPATFSTANLDAIYNGWSTTAGIIFGVNISFGSAQYTAASASAKATLTTTYSWFIFDGGLASAPFISTWQVTAGETITLPYEAAGTYSGTIDWGDSTTSVNSYANRTHTYATAGTKTISITGTITGFRFAFTGSRLNIRNITNWGTLRLGNSGAYFQGCQNLTLSTVAGTLDLTGTTNLGNIFDSCTFLTTVNGINSWSTGLVTNFSSMFASCSSFNQALSFPINTTANVTMTSMFNSCGVFNSALTFNTSSVVSMNFMFAFSNNFNQPLTFNTAAVINMQSMFRGCTAFNQNISSWNTAAVTNMSNMFDGATEFNQNIGSWNVANVTNFTGFMSTKTPATFSTTNLDAIYNGWVTVQSSRTISFGTAKYSAAGAAGRNYLTGTKLWTITDGGVDAAAFTSTWQVTAGQTITLPYEVAGTYSGTIDWGDSTTSVNSYANRTHTYAGAGTYTISITGVTTGFSFNNAGSKLNIRTITNWGTLRLGNSAGYFFGCTNLTLTTVVGTLDLTGTTNMSLMFTSCSSLTTVNGINSWSTGSVTNMSNMFNSCTNFNQALTFNTAAVANMSSMFSGCSNFNQVINFSTAAATNMSNMFSGCSNFNQVINFSTGAVTNMNGMFGFCSAFNSPITFSSTANVTNMSSMFYACNAFNKPLNFSTGAVTNMSQMFINCTAFNSTLTFSSTAAVTTMQSMFRGCSAFNQAVPFNTALVTNMVEMFINCTNFNQPINFNTAAVTNMSNMFDGATAFNQNIGSWNVASVTNFTNFMLGKTAATFSAANLDAIYSGWSASGVKPNINISFGSAQFTNAGGLAGKNILLGVPNNWTIADGGGI